jgi:two-component system CheB/CheR fusion protein
MRTSTSSTSASTPGAISRSPPENRRATYSGWSSPSYAAIYAARQAPTRSDTRRVLFEERGERRLVELRVRGIDSPEVAPRTAIVYFEELDPDGAGAAVAEDPTLEPIVSEIEDELHRTREQLRATIEQYEVSVEELKASNEELQAINEELRSAGEELETSQEELQSVNEELTTLNHELKVKIDEVSHVNGDLQNLMSSTDIGVVFLDRALNITRFTPRAVSVFNLIPSDIGRPLAHLTHKLETDELPDLARRVLQSLRVIDRDVSSRDGRRYLMRVLPYRSVEDRIDGVVITFVDVTDLRDALEARRRTEAALQASEARLRVSLLGAPLVVFSLDPQMTVTWGYAVGEPLTLGVLKIVAPHHRARVQELVDEVLAEHTPKRAEIDFEIRGELRTYDVRFERITATEITAVGFDVTANKLASELLHEADRRKDEFLATLSHELRNPLTPLKVALDVARVSTDNPEKLAAAHGIMDRQLTSISTLVEELLDLSRITQGKIELAKESVEPFAIVQAALETTGPLVSESMHELTVDAPRSTARILGDPARLTQLVVNLITNAVKYTPPRGHLQVSARVDPERHVAVFTVSDDGVGIAPELLPRVFEIFVQSRDHRGRSKQGLGIGLALVKQLVELHGGSVTARSDGVHGSEFVVELPIIR